MSRKGNCWDNAPQESFFGHMKDEIDYKSCNTFEELQILVDDYIYYYNNFRYGCICEPLSEDFSGRRNTKFP